MHLRCKTIGTAGRLLPERSTAIYPGWARGLHLQSAWRYPERLRLCWRDLHSPPGLDAHREGIIHIHRVICAAAIIFPECAGLHRSIQPRSCHRVLDLGDELRRHRTICPGVASHARCRITFGKCSRCRRRCRSWDDGCRRFGHRDRNYLTGDNAERDNQHHADVD